MKAINGYSSKHSFSHDFKVLMDHPTLLKAKESDSELECSAPVWFLGTTSLWGNPHATEYSR